MVSMHLRPKQSPGTAIRERRIQADAFHYGDFTTSFLRAFYGCRVRVVNPVTIEPQHLEDRDPWRTHMRAAIRVGPRCTNPHGSARNILTPQCATAVCVRMADAGDAMPRSLVERID
jgi:hypothetical protein